MKRFLFISMIVAAVALLGATYALAAQDPDTGSVAPQPGFVDENGDGICDWMGTGMMNGYGYGPGPNFVDEDGDGICDYCGTGRMGGYGPGTNGAGPNFVDENGDGICDYMGTGMGTMYRHQHHIR